MHIKHMHEMIENLTECTKQALENNEVCVGQYPIGDVVDMIKDLNEAEYYAHISKAMDEEKKEEEEQDKYMLKRIKEEYGEDEEKTRRYYDDWRYMRSGRFAPKGRGTYTGRSRRGYEEMFIPEMYEHDPEWARDMDRNTLNRMYYSGGNPSNANMGNMSGNRSGSTDNYNGADGRRNYDGDGRSDGRRSESRYDRARRGYSESKALHNNKTPDDEKENMRTFETLLGVVDGDIKEFKPDMSQSEKAMAAQKFDAWAKYMRQ